jgi:hypothetical protein
MNKDSNFQLEGNILDYIHLENLCDPPPDTLQPIARQSLHLVFTHSVNLLFAGDDIDVAHRDHPRGPVPNLVSKVKCEENGEHNVRNQEARCCKGAREENGIAVGNG